MPSTVSALNDTTGSEGEAHRRSRATARSDQHPARARHRVRRPRDQPAHTLQTIVHLMGGGFTPEAARSLSLIVWALIITISVKYCIFVMRADNHGEGGILALMALTGARWSGRGRWLVTLGLFGAALIYGDGIITPAISVLSAVEGLNVATEAFAVHDADRGCDPDRVVRVAATRTATIGKAFGPVMLLWFLTMAVLGVTLLVRHPEVLRALNPLHGILLLTTHGLLGFTPARRRAFPCAHRRRGALRRHGACRPHADPARLVWLRAACSRPQLCRAGRQLHRFCPIPAPTRSSSSHRSGRSTRWWRWRRWRPSSPARPSSPVHSR